MNHPQYRSNGFKKCVSNDESDSTLKHRTTPSPKKKQPNSRPLQDLPQQNHPPHIPSSSVSLPLRFSSSSNHNNKKLSKMTISRRTQQKLNDPSYIQTLRHHSVQIVDDAWNRISSTSTSSSLQHQSQHQQQQQQQQGIINSYTLHPPPLSSSYFTESGTATHYDTIHTAGTGTTSTSIQYSGTYAENYSWDGNHSIGNSTIQSESVSTNNKQNTKSSTEMATLRGTKRALRESNEVERHPSLLLPQHPQQQQHVNNINNDFDLETLEGTIPSITETRSSNLLRRVARSFRRVTGGGTTVGGRLRVVRFPSHTHHPNTTTTTPFMRVDGGGGDETTTSNIQRKKSSDKHRTKKNSEESSEEAWMCGVCGMVFANESVADRHEQQHIMDVVKGMEWNNTTNNHNNKNNHHTVATIRHEPMISPSILMPSTRTMVQVENLPNTPLLQQQQQRRRHRDGRNDVNNTGPLVVEVSPNSLQAVGTSSPMVQDAVRFTLTESTPTCSNASTPHHKNRPLHHHPHIPLQHPSQPQHIRFEDEYPGLDADLPSPTPGMMTIQQQPVSSSSMVIPASDQHLRRMRVNSNEVRFATDYDPLLSSALPQNPLAVTTTNGYPQSQVQLLEVDTLYLQANMKDRVVLADEALFDVTSRAVPMTLTHREVDAEYELKLLAQDKAYYDECTKRAMARRVNPSNRYRSDREDILAKVQNKFVDAYQLMKESDGKKGITDQYNRINKKGGKEGTTSTLMKHTDSTLYVNVMVKNSVEVVRHELERLAKQRWDVSASQDESLTRFERFRVYTQMNIVKLAGIALASDFTPRRIAVQLSNDLYRLLTPKLKRRGVTIETEIEYRVGPYFVLAVNIKTIDWWKLIKSTHKDSVQRQLRWEKERQNEKKSANPAEAETKVSLFRSNFDYLQGSFNLSVFDVIERAIALLYYVHWTIYLPICWVAYYVLLGPSLRHFIITTVADEIFSYVEEKGMEMEIRVCRTETQAAFMLSALREIRVDGQELKKKIEQSESREKGLVLGPLMGPSIAADKGPAPSIPQGFEIPENLEYIGLELNLPVGFQRLRWALLSKRSTFVTEAVYKTEARYENIVMGEWNKFPDQIGEPKLADSVNPNDFIGAEKEGEYLMPKSAFVSANMCYETHYILAYNEFCFCLKKRARNPDAPFGKTFLAWTQYLVINTGNDTCKLTCSVQPEFPHGTPMVSRQITSGMRAGTGELFVLIGSTIEKYSDEFP